jgi:tetratricopeptide (TPR) repeat protein
MNNKIRIFLFAGGLLVILAGFFVSRFISNQKIAKEIPTITNTGFISKPVEIQINDAVELAKSKPSAKNLGALGMVYHSSANYSEASKCYQLAGSLDKHEWIWDYYNGYLNMELGNSNEVIENFARVLEINPGVNLAKYYLAEEYKNQRNYDSAEELFKEISKIQKTSVNQQTRKDHFPLSTYASFQLGRIYLDKKEYETAKNTLIEIIEKNKLFGPAYKLLGTIYNMEGDTVLGKKYTIRANDFINYTPPIDTLLDKIALMSRSELYLLKKIDESEDSFHADWGLQLVNQGLKYIPDNSYLLSKAIKIYLWKNMNEKATALIDKHLELIHGNYTEIKNTGIVFHQKGMYAEAKRYWSKALEIKSDEINVVENQAKCLWLTGNREEALNLLDKLVEDNPTNTDVLSEVTDLLFQFRQKEKGNLLLSRLKRMDPANPTAKRLTADIALEKKDTQTAVRMYEAAFKGNPKDAITINQLGEIYKYRQMWGKYIDLYRNALEYNQNNPDYLARLGEVYISCPDTTQIDLELGREYSERAFTHYNCPPKTLIAAGSHLAYAYARLGEMDLAKVTISQTVNIGRRQNIPEAEQKRLEVLYQAFQNLSD